jgi:hypothetical protein
VSLEHTAHRIAHRRPRPSRGRFRSLTLALLCKFLCFLSLAGPNGIAVAASAHSPATPKTPGPSFAIADFDGDLHPDLASVEVSSTNSRQTIYSIRLQLTAGGRQAIRVVAPSGGLQILARDVNGDHAIDLVLATAALGEPVAVLLNDGRGGFKQVDQSALPGAFGNSRAALTTDDDLFIGAADAPPSSRPGISVASSFSPCPTTTARYAQLFSRPFLSGISLTSRPSRAPPLSPSPSLKA